MTQCYQNTFGDLVNQGGQGSVECDGDGSPHALGIDFGGGRWRRGRSWCDRGWGGRFGRRGRRVDNGLGMQTASHLSLGQQRLDHRQYRGGFERLLDDGIAPGALGLFLIEFFQKTCGENHPGVPVPGMAFHIAANFEARSIRQKSVDQKQIRVDVTQPEQYSLAVCQTDDLEALFAQDSFAHALRMRTVVRQQDAAHCLAAGWAAGGVVAVESDEVPCCAALVVWFFFFLFFFFCIFAS